MDRKLAKVMPFLKFSLLGAMGESPPSHYQPNFANPPTAPHTYKNSSNNFLIPAPTKFPD